MLKAQPAVRLQAYTLSAYQQRTMTAHDLALHAVYTAVQRLARMTFHTC